MNTVDLILHRAAETGPRCGTATVIAIDGPSGSGKTTLATRVAHAPGEARTIIHMDDLYPGWTGLRAGGRILYQDILAPISRGEPGRYQRYDWHTGHRAETHTIAPTGVLIVEGVGSVRTELLHLLSLIVVVDEPDEATRLARVIGRDGPASAVPIRAWMKDEAALHAETGTRDRADLVVDGAGRLVHDAALAR